ncbi:MAG: HD domain-containing protein [Treponema sp.]|nr:HD domain-containing protein [Candidatus Treponema caballi]
MNSVFEENGFEAFLVGGAVRDLIRGKPASDWDVATNATPDDVIRIFKRVIPTGISHGTVTVHFMKEEIEVTTYRLEKDYSDGRHPDSVTYAADIEEDLSRRDFTMNAIAASLKDGSLVDPFGGQEDIKAHIIRTVGDADQRFSEDGLRPVRAIRFAAQTGFDITSETLAAIPRARQVTAKISIERFRDEFVKLISSDAPSKGLRLMEETGILEQFLPEIASCRGVIQADERGHHQFDVLDHMLYALDGAAWLERQRGSAFSDNTGSDTGLSSKVNLEVRLAALFHDIGKPSTRRVDHAQLAGAPEGIMAEIYTFFGHENKGASITKSVLSRLRFPNSVIQYVSHLVKQHMFHYESTWTDAAIRRFIMRATPEETTSGASGAHSFEEALNDLFDVRICDVCGMSGTPALLSEGPWKDNLLELRSRIESIRSEAAAFSLKDLAVKGKDLMEAGIAPGKQLGLILGELLDAVVEDPTCNTRDALIPLALNLYKTLNR